jgi:hypothetical protein
MHSKPGANPEQAEQLVASKSEYGSTAGTVLVQWAEVSYKLVICHLSDHGSHGRAFEKPYFVANF